MRLMLISLDGLWEKDFQTLESLPYIGSLIRAGTSCKNVQTVYPSLTYPVHTTILTGCRPDGHGISHNQPFAPDLPSARRPWYWDSASIKAPTLHQLVHEKGGRVASVLWPVSGKNRHIRWNFSEAMALPGENQTLKMLRYGSAAWILAMEARYGRQRKSTRQPDLDDYATLLCEKLLGMRKPPDLITLHLTDCDEMRHHHGADSEAAGESIRRQDKRVGRLMTALDRQMLSRDTVIAIVSDHGLVDVSRPISLDAALKKAGLGGICRAQSTGMGAYLYFSPETADNVEKVRVFLDMEGQQLGISAIYCQEELMSMGAPGEVHLAVEAAPEVVFVDDLPKDKWEMATHGFGPAHPAAQCLFILWGPGIKKGVRIGSASMEDIAPTLMRVMGMDMPSAKGKILSDCFLDL